MKNFFDRVKYANPNLPKSTKIIYGVLFLLLLLGMLRNVIVNPWVLLQIVVLIFSISAHELAHGYTANKFGDPTAKLAGRLTLNPVKHIDPLGILVPIILIFTGSSFVIGWAKPVPVSYRILKKNKIGYFCVSAAGIIVNLLFVFIAATLMKYVKVNSQIYTQFVNYLLRINLVLAVFNLIPIPPLDGSKILEAFLSERGRRFLESMEKFGFLLIILLLWTNTLQQFLIPLYEFFIKIINMYILY